VKGCDRAQKKTFDRRGGTSTETEEQGKKGITPEGRVGLAPMGRGGEWATSGKKGGMDVYRRKTEWPIAQKKKGKDRRDTLGALKEDEKSTSRKKAYHTNYGGKELVGAKNGRSIGEKKGRGSKLLQGNAGTKQGGGDP